MNKVDADRARKAKEKEKLRSQIDNLKERMRGKWMSCIGYLAPDLYEAAEYCGPMNCPNHKDHSQFRFFPDSNDTGAGHCNICGQFGDGIAVLQWINRWSFFEALEATEAWVHGYEIELRSKSPGRLTEEKYKLPREYPQLRRSKAGLDQG